MNFSNTTGHAILLSSITWFNVAFIVINIVTCVLVLEKNYQITACVT